MVLPLVLVIAVTVTAVVSVVVCQIKRVKKITAKPSNIYANPLQGLEVNEAYEAHVVTNVLVNVAYATNMELKQNQPYTPNMVDFREKDNVSSNLDMERDETYASTTDLLDSVQSEEAYATVAELEPYATVTTVTKGNGAAEYGESIMIAEERTHGESKSYGSAIVIGENKASKPERSSGAVNEYADYLSYDFI